MQNPLGPWRQQEDGPVDTAPTGPAPQRGRPKRPPSAPRVRVLTLRVPEESLRRLAAYTAQVQAA